MNRRSIGPLRIVLDLILLVACGIPILIYKFAGSPFKRGFYCGDESIRYPYHDSTVPSELLIPVGLVIPIIIIVLVECLRCFRWDKRGDSHILFGSRPIHRVLIYSYQFIGSFLVGACLNQVAVNVAKYTVGRHRPHFIDICKPSVGMKCHPNNTDTYMTDFTCTGSDKDAIEDSMLSFYSGHSAYSLYVAVYTVLYLQYRLDRSLYSPIILPILQSILIIVATYVSFTRISDYKHHWSDVLIGMIMGTLFALFTAIMVSRMFERRKVYVDVEEGKNGGGRRE